jgi:hypothetical protein
VLGAGDLVAPADELGAGDVLDPAEAEGVALPGLGEGGCWSSTTTPGISTSVQPTAIRLGW